MVRKRIFLGVLTLLVSGGVIGFLATKDGNRPEAGRGQEALRTAARVGRRAPDLSVRMLDGRRLTLADIGGRPTVLYFTAYSCFTCIPKLQELSALYKRIGDRDLEIVAIDIDPTSTPELFAAFRRAAGSPRFTFALDERGQTAAAYRVPATAWTVAVDRSGRVRFAGDYDTAEVRLAIKRMLA